MASENSRPYGGVRILDLTRELGSYCTRLFADLGAEVIRIEAPEGRADRRTPPTLTGVDPASFGGVPFAFFNLNKKSVTLDLKTPAGRAVFDDLVAASQVVVYEAGREAEIELAQILAVPGVRVVTAISYFGLTGPYSHFVGSDLVAQSLGGIAWLSGEPGKPPLQLAGQQSVFVTSLYAAAATAIALWHTEGQGVGHMLDVSAQEAIAHSLQNANQVYDLEGRVSSRGGEGVRDATESAFVCKDGYVFLAAPLSLSASWSGLLQWMRDENFDGLARLSQPDWADRPLRATAPMKDEFRALFERFVADKTKAELGAEALRRKLVMAPVSRIADLQADPQLIFRRYFQKLAVPGLGKDAVFPGAPYRLSEPLWRLERGAPRLGEDNDAILGAVSARQSLR
ncbi:CoA transferase [Bosea sp. 124]|uniref:CaiB/BaiF CoA transferase family protein n=1 Tax=Bosea sp. 124 TaxID=2135642 RepID=UPI000D46B0F9|nr:CoA transferase [Bosea sp. 124]PTM43425.1 benzylsuccinate CoA-transferase BbsE subunit [Bosea sp. 124]